MSYPVTYKGVTVMVESLDEAIILTERLTAEKKKTAIHSERHRSVAKINQPETSQPDPQRASGFLKYLPLRERKVLHLLAKNQNGIGTDELANLAGIATMDIKYCLKTIAAIIKKRGMSNQIQVERDKITSVRPPKSVYRLVTDAESRNYIASLPEPKPLGSL